MKNSVVIDKKTGLVIGGSSAVLLALVSQPANAQNAAVAEVESTVNQVGGIAGIAASIVILAMGVRIAIKQVNRVMTKG